MYLINMYKLYLALDNKQELMKIKKLNKLRISLGMANGPGVKKGIQNSCGPGAGWASPGYSCPRQVAWGVPLQTNNIMVGFGWFGLGFMAYQSL